MSRFDDRGNGEWTRRRVVRRDARAPSRCRNLGGASRGWTLDEAHRARQRHGLADEPLSLLEPGAVPAQIRSFAAVLQSWSDAEFLVGHADDLGGFGTNMVETTALSGRNSRPDQEQTGPACQWRNRLRQQHRAWRLAPAF